MSSDDNTDEQILHALVGIGAELTRIRRLLEQDSDAEPTTEDATFTCRSCGAMFGDEDYAHEHARSEHGAPEGAETDLIT
jgi:hypothetical protein